MKFPEDIEYPELDPRKKAEIDELHGRILAMQAQRHDQQRPPPPKFKMEALRKLEPQERSAVRYVLEMHLRECHEWEKAHPGQD
ncbi:hypothetical protein ACHMW6_31635 [Pseudoduganella sp. UC29_106]|uniref:hypothetical protein n=1 Tax=Pseudoduganella sp. UC29_106 TaxID=3374553 RepID=UPI003757862F